MLNFEAVVLLSYRSFPTWQLRHSPPVGNSPQVKNHYLEQGFPTGGTRTPKGYEIEHQGVRRSLGHRAAYISLIEQYISQNVLGGTKDALTTPESR